MRVAPPFFFGGWMSDDRFVEVRFLPGVATEFAEAWPGLPPADEMIVKIRVKPCRFCGGETLDGEIGGIDPVGITEDGELIGEFVCKNCMEEGK